MRVKSPATLALEHDRMIRRERREQKRIEREKRKAERAERKRRHEICVSREIKPVKNGKRYASIFNADIVHYRPHDKWEECLIEKEE